MTRFSFGVFGPLFLSACASGPYVGGPVPVQQAPVTVAPTDPVGVNPLARSATYACEDLTTVVLTEGQPTARVTFNSGLVLSLAQQPVAGGLSYGTPQMGFRAAGGEGTMFNDGRVVRCRVR